MEASPDTLPHSQMLFLQCSVPLRPKESPHLEEQAGNPKGSGVTLSLNQLCDLRQTTEPLWASVSSSVIPVSQGSCKGRLC